jgi:hypothetical protein
MQRLNLRRKCEALRTIYRHRENAENRWHNLGMRWLIELVFALKLPVAAAVLVLTSTHGALAQGQVDGTVIDLRKYQHADGTVRQHPQTFIPGYKPKLAPEPKADVPVNQRAASDLIVVQPKLTIRTVGNLREKMSVVQGQSLIGRNEFEISCSVGAAYAQIPGEDVSFRFTRHSDCKSVLQSGSVTNPCRSKLAVNRQAQTITLVGKACGAGAFANSAAEDSRSPETSDVANDASEADSLAERARSARLRARQIAR